MENLNYVYTFRTPEGSVDPSRVISTDTKLVPSEVALLDDILAMCEEREPGQQYYKLVKPLRFEWLNGGTLRKRTFHGLTNGEAFEVMSRLSQHGETRCTTFFPGEVYCNVSRNLTPSPDRMDREIAKVGGV
jgi:hypothetical protein